MPTKRTPRTRAPAEGVTECQWAKMMDMPEPEGANPFEWLDKLPQQVWEAHRDAVLAEWVRLHPGTRPSHWWQFDAPEPRQRLGGTGRPASTEGTNIRGGNDLRYGVPVGWTTKREAFYWKDDAIASLADAVDPSDPPRYESQAAYLVRLSLTLEGERARLKKADFEPEVIRPKSMIPVIHPERGFTGEYTVYED